MSTDFLKLGIRQEINDDLKKSGITVPTPVQVQTIPILMVGKDIITQSQTGTGKTLAFLLPILEKIDVDQRSVQALIITPTRELALQITKEAAKLAGTLGVSVLSVYGGQDVERQIKKLKESTHIVIGTPGRLMDHIRRKTISLSEVTKLVLDEADQMLHMGFLNDVEEIIHRTSAKRQTMLFSATMPPKVSALATKYMNKPTEIRVQSQHVTLDEIKQIMVEVNQKNKLDKLCSMIDEYRPYLAIVFCHTKPRTIALTESLAQRGYEVDELHGDLSQAKRELVMRRFKSAKLQILVATDIAARGLDIEGVTHIFNYDIPHDVESYIHRIGRTGRAGQTGIAITFYLPEERLYLEMIEHGISASVEKFTVNGRKILTNPNRNKLEGTGDAAKHRNRKVTGKPALPRDQKKHLGKKVEQKSSTPEKSKRKPIVPKKPTFKKQNNTTGKFKSNTKSSTSTNTKRQKSGR